MRVVAYIDGFNLYHAISDLSQNHLKWVDLKALCKIFAPSPQYEIKEIYYFSAYAKWLSGPYSRHRAYVKALESMGVTPIMGNFKPKDRECFSCNHSWVDHEEKETDVNIAVYLTVGAFKDSYDRALVISGDSDLSPAIELVNKKFPMKDIKIITPVGRFVSSQLRNAVGGVKNCKEIKPVHLNNCLLPESIYDDQGKMIVQRPSRYAPPT